MLLVKTFKVLINNYMYRQLSSSQLNFFRMLDEKIEMVSGNQYNHLSIKNKLLSTINIISVS